MCDGCSAPRGATVAPLAANRAMTDQLLDELDREKGSTSTARDPSSVDALAEPARGRPLGVMYLSAVWCLGAGFAVWKMLHLPSELAPGSADAAKVQALLALVACLGLFGGTGLWRGSPAGYFLVLSSALSVLVRAIAGLLSAVPAFAALGALEPMPGGVAVSIAVFRIAGGAPVLFYLLSETVTSHCGLDEQRSRLLVLPALGLAVVGVGSSLALAFA